MAHAHTSVNLHEFVFEEYVFEADFYSCQAHGCMVREIYMVQSRSSRTHFFLKSKTKDDILFLLLNKLHWHIHRLLRGCTVSEKLPKIPLFGPSLIHQLWLLGSQQHPQSRVLLTTFSTWGTENSLAEINLDSMGVDKGL